jgi:hypothetical protein
MVLQVQVVLVDLLEIQVNQETLVNLEPMVLVVLVVQEVLLVTQVNQDQ